MTSIKRGFTLIELLVVIAIIGILSSVVLASLNTARSKGNDAAIKANTDSIGSQAALYYSDNSNSYGAANTGAGASCSATGTLFENTTITAAITSIETANGAGTVVCTSGANTYMIASQLISDNTKYWCIDSTGNKKELSAAPANTVTACP
jgi:prepilin-type N-terminal cleavage/methylation domain-containing protein